MLQGICWLQSSSCKFISGVEASIFEDMCHSQLISLGKGEILAASNLTKILGWHCGVITVYYPNNRLDF